MKLMKHITIALVLCAIPAVAVGQTVSCDSCTHVASVYMGKGGVIATADDADKVTWVASCGGVTRSGELMANDDGVVAALWDGDLACMADGGAFEIGPVKDGGWFWITDETNSAVGGLVSNDVLKNDMADITDGGEGVSMTMGKGAVLLKEASSGRVGILPNILPKPPMEALRKCGADDRGPAGTSATAAANVPNARFVRRDSACALGGGGTITLATTTNSFTGATAVVPNNSTLTRPGGTGKVVVTVDLWADGSGHFTTAMDGHALLGEPLVAISSLRALVRLKGVSYTARLGSGPTGEALESETAAGITMDTMTPDVATFTIEADSNYCSSRNNHSATVTVTAGMVDAMSAKQTTPARSRHWSGTVGGTRFTVVCPAAAGAAANTGRELVPENPFPTE
jgi:hypothetical protein